MLDLFPRKRPAHRTVKLRFKDRPDLNVEIPATRRGSYLLETTGRDSKFFDYQAVLRGSYIYRAPSFVLLQDGYPVFILPEQGEEQEAYLCLALLGLRRPGEKRFEERLAVWNDDMACGVVAGEETFWVYLVEDGELDPALVDFVTLKGGNV